MTKVFREKYPGRRINLLKLYCIFGPYFGIVVVLDQKQVEGCLQILNQMQRRDLFERKSIRGDNVIAESLAGCCRSINGAAKIDDHLFGDGWTRYVDQFFDLESF